MAEARPPRRLRTLRGAAASQRSRWALSSSAAGVAMKIGFHLTPFWSPTDRGATRIIDEAVAVVERRVPHGLCVGVHRPALASRIRRCGRSPSRCSRAWPRRPASMRLKTSVLLLPMLNAVEVAENVATLDHICHGRLDVGVAIGYREAELEAVGLARVDRVPKLEESLELMKRLWARRGGDLPRRATRRSPMAAWASRPIRRPIRRSRWGRRARAPPGARRGSPTASSSAPRWPGATSRGSPGSSATRAARQGAATPGYVGAPRAA